MGNIGPDLCSTHTVRQRLILVTIKHMFIKHGFMSIKHSFLTIKHGFLFIKHSFLSIKHDPLSIKHAPYLKDM